MPKKYVIIIESAGEFIEHNGKALIDEDDVEEAVRQHASDYAYTDDVLNYITENTVVAYEVTQSFKLTPPAGKIFVWSKQ
jgi:hypothetical protein